MRRLDIGSDRRLQAPTLATVTLLLVRVLLALRLGETAAAAVGVKPAKTPAVGAQHDRMHNHISVSGERHHERAQIPPPLHGHQAARAAPAPAAVALSHSCQPCRWWKKHKKQQLKHRRSLRRSLRQRCLDGVIGFVPPTFAPLAATTPTAPSRGRINSRTPEPRTCDAESFLPRRSTPRHTPWCHRAQGRPSRSETLSLLLAAEQAIVGSPPNGDPVKAALLGVRRLKAPPLSCAAEQPYYLGSPRNGDPRKGLGAGRRREKGQDEEEGEEEEEEEEVDASKVALGGKGLEVCRVINGLCQEPVDGGADDPTDALRAMDRLAETGLTTFQLGNAMGGGRALAERRAGSYLKSAAGAASGTAEVRFLNTLSLRPDQPVTRRAVTAALERSLRRMGVERLDLVQLCWHDFEDRYFLDALCYLEESEWVSNIGVCGFGAAPLALAQKNGFAIASNLVASSIITAPIGGLETVRQCREKGVEMIASGASLGGLVSDKWLLRSAPVADDWELDGASLEFRQALSDIHAWGSSSSDSGSSRAQASSDPWYLYQTKLLPELQTVARKHGRGITPADVATAVHLCRKPASAAATVSGSYGARNNLAPLLGNAVSAVSVPVRISSGGSLSARRSAAEQEDLVSGRRGAELAAMLDQEDLERIAMAVRTGAVRSRGEGEVLPPGSKLATGRRLFPFLSW